MEVNQKPGPCEIRSLGHEQPDGMAEPQVQGTDLPWKLSLGGAPVLPRAFDHRRGVLGGRRWDRVLRTGRSEIH